MGKKSTSCYSIKIKVVLSCLLLVWAAGITAFSYPILASEKTSAEIFEIFICVFNCPSKKRPPPNGANSPNGATPTSIPVLSPTTSLLPPSNSGNPPNGEAPTSIPVLSPTTSLLPNLPASPNCPGQGGRIIIPNANYKHLNRYLPCDKPRMIVIHWSAAWSSAQATFNVLNDRDRSCQFAVDDQNVIQMLDLFPNAVERGWCAGGDSNVGSINFEITGAWFDEVIRGPSGSERYRRLMVMTDKVVDISCQMIRKYNIPKNAIYGHYELQYGKVDPGVSYLQFFKNKVNQKC